MEFIRGKTHPNMALTNCISINVKQLINKIINKKNPKSYVKFQFA